jgi:RIO kinase 1
LIR